MARHIQAGGPRAAVTLFALAALLCLGADTSRAERAWVKDEVRLNLRTGPGLEYRILGVMKTGDAAEILGREEGWTQVRVDGIGDGWMPEGYLIATPPARLRLAESEAELEGLRQRLASLDAKTQQLESTSAELATRDGERGEELARLTRENMQLRAGARWPEWITGACVLSAGMIVGAMLHRNTSSRRPASRVRL